MGKTQTPLRILCHPDIAGWEEVKALAAQGHTVMENPEISVYDLILAPQAHIMLPEMRKYLPLAVKRVQQARNRVKRDAKKASKT